MCVTPSGMSINVSDVQYAKAFEYIIFIFIVRRRCDPRKDLWSAVSVSEKRFFKLFAAKEGCISRLGALQLAIPCSGDEIYL